MTFEEDGEVRLKKKLLNWVGDTTDIGKWFVSETELIDDYDRDLV